MPATHTKDVKKSMDKFKVGKRNAASQHVMTSGNANKRPEKFTLIILEKEDKKGRKVIHVFATGVPVDVVCGFKRGNTNGSEAFVKQYRVKRSIKTWYSV